MTIFSKLLVKKEKKLLFLRRLWRQRRIHENNNTEVNGCESDNREDYLSAVDVDIIDQSGTGLSDSKDIGKDPRGWVLKDLFSQPEWSVPDGLNEYDEDYTSFTSRGTIVTQDMMREYLRAENQTVRETEQNVSHFSANGTTAGNLDGECEEKMRISSGDLGVGSDSSNLPHDQS